MPSFKNPESHNNNEAIPVGQLVDIINSLIAHTAGLPVNAYDENFPEGVTIQDLIQGGEIKLTWTQEIDQNIDDNLGNKLLGLIKSLYRKVTIVPLDHNGNQVTVSSLDSTEKLVADTIIQDLYKDYDFLQQPIPFKLEEINLEINENDISLLGSFLFGTLQLLYCFPGSKLVLKIGSKQVDLLTSNRIDSAEKLTRYILSNISLES